MTMSRSRGFTLIEVMIAVVVVAILAAIAYPSYQDSVRKSRRAEGKSALLKAAQVQERFFTDQNRYATQLELAAASGVTGGGAIINSGENPNLAPNAYYTIVVTPANPTTTFTLTATPNPAFPDPECGNFTLTSTSVRCWSTSGLPAATCAPPPGTNAARCRW